MVVLGDVKPVLSLTESAFSCVLSDIKLPKKLAYLCKFFTSWIFLGKKALLIKKFILKNCTKPAFSLKTIAKT